MKLKKPPIAKGQRELGKQQAKLLKKSLQIMKKMRVKNLNGLDGGLQIISDLVGIVEDKIINENF